MVAAFFLGNSPTFQSDLRSFDQTEFFSCKNLSKKPLFRAFLAFFFSYLIP